MIYSGFSAVYSVKLVLLSNSTKRADATMARMAKRGLLSRPEAFSGCVTSGEVAWQMFKDGGGQAFGARGNRCVVFTLGDNYTRTWLKGLDLELVDSAAKADFMLVIGMTHRLDSFEAEHSVRFPGDVDPHLALAAKFSLPMVCLNPDLRSPPRKDGSYSLTAGTMAKR